MKKLLIILMATLFIMTLGACANAPAKDTPTSKNPTDTPITDAPVTEAPVTEAPTPEAPKKDIRNLSASEFESLLQNIPVAVVSTKYAVQDEQYKALYPDMLQAIIQNNTEADIKNAVVAFVAWDKNNLPVKIKANIDFTDGSYIRHVNFNDINLVPNTKFGENNGFSIDESCGIATCKAIVVSYETFDGNTWENPYFDAFASLYEGNKLSDDLSVEVEIVEITTPESTNDSATSANLSQSELDDQLTTQPLAVVSTKYVVQDEQYKALYPDMLQAIIKNNTETDIKNAVVAFVAWDKNNLPVKIKANIDFTDGSYIRQVDYSDINLVPNENFGEGTGFTIDEKCGIATIKAIVVSYETFDGNTWDNPYYDDFVSLYEGKRLD